MSDDRANFCSVDGSRLPDPADAGPLAKLDSMTIRQVADCIQGVVEDDYADQSAIEVAIENLGKKIDVAMCGEKLSTVGVVALGMLTNVMGRFDLREVNSTPSAPKPSTRIQ